MEDFNALASSLAQGVGDVRGCLILSRDGLVLGAHPAKAEGVTTPAWVRFASIGDPERGFAQFGMETWCYVRRGPYAGFALVGPGARPGLVIDHMDQVLLAAEEGRSRHEGLRGTEGRARGGGAPVQATVHLHPEHPTTQPLVIEAPAPIVAQIASADHADELPPLPSPGPEPIEAPIGDGAEVLEPSPDAFAYFLGSRATPRRRDRRRCPSQSRSLIPPPGPSPDQRRTSTSRTTRPRSRGRRR